MGSPDRTEQTSRDADLDAIAGMASPDYEPGDDHDKLVGQAINTWQRGDPRLRKPTGKRADAFMYEVRHGEPVEGPIFRGQGLGDPEPTGTKGWTRSLATAATFGLDWTPIEPMVTLYVSEGAAHGLDLTAWKEKHGKGWGSARRFGNYDDEQEIVVENADWKELRFPVSKEVAQKTMDGDETAIVAAAQKELKFQQAGMGSPDAGAATPEEVRDAAGLSGRPGLGLQAGLGDGHQRERLCGRHSGQDARENQGRR